MTYPPPGADPYGQQPPQDPFGQPPQYPGTDPYGQQPPPPQYPGADPYGQQPPPQYPGGYQHPGEQPTMQGYPPPAAGQPGQPGWPPPSPPPGGYGGYPGYGAPAPRKSNTGLLVGLVVLAAVVVLGGGAAAAVYFISQSDSSGSGTDQPGIGQPGGDNGDNNGDGDDNGNGAGPVSCQASADQATPLPDRERTEAVLDLSCPGSAPAMTVTVDISHSYPPDLTIQLRAPDGHVFDLWEQGQGSRSDPQISQTFQVDVSGRVLDGPWTLIVEDHVGIDDGTLDSWSIEV